MSAQQKQRESTTALYCTHCFTFTPKIPSAAFDLAPQSKTTTVCLAFCIDPSSMLLI